MSIIGSLDLWRERFGQLLSATCQVGQAELSVPGELNAQVLLAICAAYRHCISIEVNAL